MVNLFEAGTTEQIVNTPYHPYTRALVDSSPKSNLEIPAKSRLLTLPVHNTTTTAFTYWLSFRTKMSKSTKKVCYRTKNN